MADVFLLPQALSAQTKFDINLDAYPHIKSIVANLNALPEV
jgi:hypothetical protein